MESKEFLFPFVGAGVAKYDEESYLTIKFERAPSNEEQAKIMELVPAPFALDEENSNAINEVFHGAILDIESINFINVIITVTYDDDDDPDPSYATPDALKAFQKDIEEWLLAIHKFCPIEIVFRSKEAVDSVKHADWHKASLLEIASLIKKWDKQTFDKEEYTYLSKLITGLLEYKKSGVSTEIIMKFAPWFITGNLFKNKKYDELLSLIKKNFAEINPPSLKIFDDLWFILGYRDDYNFREHGNMIKHKISDDFYLFLKALADHPLFYYFIEDNDFFLSVLIKKAIDDDEMLKKIEAQIISCSKIENKRFKRFDGRELELVENTESYFRDNEKAKSFLLEVKKKIKDEA